MFKTINLTPRQKQAISLLRKPNLYTLLYGGSRSGKTVLILVYLLYQALATPNTKILIARHTFNDVKTKLLDGTFQEVWEMMSDDNLEVFINRQDYFVKFPNGSKITFGGLADKNQSEKILGAEYDFIFINELSQVSWNTFELVRTRLNGKGKIKMICDTNPPHNGKNHWIYSYFIEKKTPKGKELTEFARNNIEQMAMNPIDNPNLHKDYIESLRSGSETYYQRYALGQFVSGGEDPVYYNFGEENEVEEPIVYDSTAEHWVGWDFGVANPTAMIYFQLKNTPEGLVIEIINEHEESRRGVEYFANFHKKQEGWSDYRHAGDPSARASGVNLQSWKGELLKLDIFLTTPKNYEIDNWVLTSNNHMAGLIINRNQTPKTYDMLLNWQNKEDGKPDAQSEYSHLGTAFYYFVAMRLTQKPAEIIGV